MTGTVRIDEEGRRVVWRPSPTALWFRGAVFLLLGVGLPAATLSSDPASVVTVGVLLVTAATAAWLAAGLRQGWEIDEHGIETGIGRRRTTRISWGEVRTVEVDGRDLVAATRDDRRLVLGQDEPGTLWPALTAAVDLGIVPVHVEVAAEDGDGGHLRGP